jgi:hypothetical protein
MRLQGGESLPRKHGTPERVVYLQPADHSVVSL